MQHEEPSVCIILVNYNNYKDTVECVKSILNIEYKNYKIILVDNNSSESNKLLDDDFLKSNTILLESRQNNGFSAGNNIGIKYAAENIHPDYYLLLNNDTTVDKMFLTNLIKCSKKQNDNAIVGGKIYYYSDKKMIWYAGGSYDTDSGFATHFGYKKNDDGSYDKDIYVTFITGCLMLIPHQVLDKVGLLDEGYFLYSEDTDYCCRARLLGFNLVYCSNCVIYHKVSAATGDNSPMQQYYMLRNDLYLISKYGTNKGIAYLKRLNNTRIQISRGTMNFQSAMKAYCDFIQGKKGRISNKSI